MNREQYGNYVKGATAAYADIISPRNLSTADFIYTLARDGRKMDITNWLEDGLFIKLGYNDMRCGIID